MKLNIKPQPKLLNGEIVHMYNSLTNVKGLTGIKLLYAVKKNKELLKPIATALHPSELIPNLDAHNEYAQKYNQAVDDDIKAQLNIEYADVIAEMTKHIEEYNRFMREECEYQPTFFKVPLTLAPDNQEAFDAISFMIADFTPEQEAKFNELFDSII